MLGEFLLWWQKQQDWLLQQPFVHDATGFISAPGLLVFQTLGLHLSSDDWPLPFLMGYWFWFALCRFCFFAIGRQMGFASITHYHAWSLLWLHWAKPFQACLELRRVKRHNSTGDGPKEDWASWWETASYVFNSKRGDIPLGRLAFLQRFGLHCPVGLPDGEKHIACISYSGGGKTSWLMTWLGCLHPQSAAFINDMDGSMINAYGARLEEQGHKVVKLDADSINKSFPNGYWNPVDEFTHASRLLTGKDGEDHPVQAVSKHLAHALITQDSQYQPVFCNNARIIWDHLQLLTWLTQEEKSLLRCRQILTRGMPELIRDPKTEDAFSCLAKFMADLPARYARGEIDDGAGGAICNAIANAARLIGDGRHENKFRDTADFQTSWMDDANVKKIIGGTAGPRTAGKTLACHEMKLSNTVVFFCSTLADLQSRLAPLVRSFIALAMYAQQRYEPQMKKRHATLYLLDEFSQCGRLDLALAFPGYRKYGCRILIISQSVGLLRAMYPEFYKEFFNQAVCTVWLGISKHDTESLQYLCAEILGECIRRKKISGHIWIVRTLLRIIGVKGLPPARYEERPQLLLTPGQAASFLDERSGQMIVTRSGRAPFRNMQRLRYWRDLAVWQYRVHKGHGEVFARACTREVSGVASRAPVAAMIALPFLVLLLALMPVEAWADAALSLFSSAVEKGVHP